MESFITLIGGLLGISQILWPALFPRIAKAFGYLCGAILPVPDLNGKLSDEERANGWQVYTQHIFLESYGQEPLDTEIIDRQPSVSYDQPVRILNVIHDDPKKIQPHVEPMDTGVTVEARWNAADQFGMDIVFASKTRPRHAKIDARFIGVKEVTSRLLSMRLSGWYLDFGKRFAPAYLFFLILIFLATRSLKQPGTSTPSPDSVSSLVNGVYLGLGVVILGFVPFMLLEHFVLYLRSVRRRDQLNAELRAERGIAHVSQASTSEERLKDATSSEVTSHGRKHAAHSDGHSAHSSKR